MPEGILIDYNDGRPAMAITAGLRAPSFCTTFSGWSSQSMQYPVNTPLVPGSQAIVVPTNPIYIYSFAEFDVAIMTGVTRNGDAGVIIGAETIGGKALMNPLMILVKIIKLRWIHILSYDQMVSRKINNQTTRCANSIFYTTLFTNSAPNYT